MKLKYKLSGLVLIILINFTNCKKAVDVGPPVTNPVAATVYTSNVMATAVLTSVYERMMENSGSFTTAISLLTGFSSDELKNYSTNNPYPQYYSNSLLSTSYNPFWNELYQYIYTSNAALDGLSKSQGVTDAVKKQLIGEAKFIRAFCHFYLVNLYGEVPLVITTDYRVNSLISRSSKDKVYQQIILDLIDAQNLLSINYVKPDAVSGTIDRVRPTKWAATALLARVYLYTHDWSNAEAQATTIINNVATYGLVSNLNSVFLKNSNEAIWQLQVVRPTAYNTWDGYTFILTSAPDNTTRPGAISDYLLNAFELGDNRKMSWIGNYSTYYYPYKYKIQTGTSVTEYLMVLRLAEQYLIRAEARAQLNNNISETQADLNMIRARAGLPNTTAATQSALLTAIAHERQVELFTEWGHRWFDLKRTNNLDAIMSVVTPVKGGTWNSNKKLYPIPLIEIQRDPNLTQNTGY